VVKIGVGTEREAHIDNEPHAEFAQLVVIATGGCGADEEIVGDVREVHAGNSITG